MSTKVNVWLINTGWTGGPFGVGSRMKLSYTRAMITAALKGQINNVEFEKHPYFWVGCAKIMSKCPFRNFKPKKYLDGQRYL